MLRPPLSLDPPAAAWPADWFEPAGACLWCGSNACSTLIEGVRDWFFEAVPGEFAFAQCRECRALLLQQRPGPTHIAKAYTGYYTHGGEEGSQHRPGTVQRIGRALSDAYARRRYGRSSAASDVVRAALFGLFPVRRAEVDAAHRYLPAAPAEVLDYGCGNGDFLVRAAGLGHKVVGVDFDPEAASYARTRGLAVVEPADLPEAEFAHRFDHITAAHVIEHVADPLALLRDFRRWLKPGGLLFLEVPNAAAAGLAVHGRFWRGLEAPRHFSLPSEQSLRGALGAAGFAPVMFGHRAFARRFMDAASHAAAQAHGGSSGGEGKLALFDGPEMLTCLARAV